MDPVQASIKQAITQYFINLDGADASNIYDLVMSQVERPLLLTVMQHAKNNQSKAAQWLGLSRNTLRKLLAKHQII
jgi:Fis family transcriptional regulator